MSARDLSSFQTTRVPSNDESAPSGLILHPIPAFAPEGARVLILGSFPSVASRGTGFFYGHRQNRFWAVLAGVFSDTIPGTVDEKKALLTTHGVALWDVIGACRIRGSADSSITDVCPNDLSPLLARLPIRQIYVNGQTAARYYARYQFPAVGRAAVCLPSTSPANAAWSLARLTDAWRVIAGN